MKKISLILIIILASAVFAAAKETFVFKGVSKIYDVRVEIEKCEEDSCGGKGVFYIQKKNQTQVIQTIRMNETFLKIHENKRRKGNLTELYGDWHLGVKFADYNFDGTEDLAVSNGYYAPYGGVSYDYYLHHKSTGKFVIHKQLTEIAAENMFLDVKPKGKYLETFTKDGCCWHQKARYRFAGNRLQKFYIYTEDATSRQGSKVKLITERLVRGKWHKTTKLISEKEYLKNQ